MDFLLAVCVLAHLVAAVLTQKAKITQAPQTVKTVQGNHEAVFTCAGQNAYYFKWFVDGLRENHPDSNDRGVKTYNGKINNVLKFSSMTLPASMSNNNASIACSMRSMVDEDGPTDPVFLQVQGYLENVTDLHYTFNGSCFAVMWKKPFTLSNVPILGYSVIIYNEDNTSVLINDTTQETLYQFCDSGDIGIIKVAGYNELGIGEYSSPVWSNPEKAVMLMSSTISASVSSSISYAVTSLSMGVRLTMSSLDNIIKSSTFRFTAGSSLTTHEVITVGTPTFQSTVIITLNNDTTVAAAECTSSVTYAYAGMAVITFLNIGLLLSVVTIIMICRKRTTGLALMQKQQLDSTSGITDVIQLHPNNAYEEVSLQLKKRLNLTHHSVETT